MEFERGIKRIVSVLSILVGLACCWLAFISVRPTVDEVYVKALVVFCGGMMAWGSVWVIFFLLRWIIRGFCSDTKK